MAGRGLVALLPRRKVGQRIGRSAARPLACSAVHPERRSRTPLRCSALCGPSRPSSPCPQSPSRNHAQDWTSASGMHSPRSAAPAPCSSAAGSPGSTTCQNSAWAGGAVPGLTLVFLLAMSLSILFQELINTILTFLSNIS